MPRVFVVGARIPAGGTFMAYHLGRLLHRHFGYEFYDVEMAAPGQAMFQYDIPIKGITLPAMESLIRADDILVANPSFSSHMFGLRLPGRKVMYVQDFKTYSVLDVHFDLYASASHVVHDFVQSTWGVESAVIAPFIQLKKMPAAKAWSERPKDSIVVYLKHSSPEHQALFDMLCAQMGQLRPDIDLRQHMLQGRKLTHTQFMEALGAARHAVILSIAEGFGLVPLEAMAMGTTVLGLDGIAGREYMRFGENSLALPFNEAKSLAPSIVHALENEDVSRRVAEAGQHTAAEYGYAPFKEAWLEQFARFLGKDPA